MAVDASLAQDLAPTEQSVDEGFVSITRNKCSFLFKFFKLVWHLWQFLILQNISLYQLRLCARAYCNRGLTHQSAWRPLPPTHTADAISTTATTIVLNVIVLRCSGIIHIDNLTIYPKRRSSKFDWLMHFTLYSSCCCCIIWRPFWFEFDPNQLIS